MNPQTMATVLGPAREDGFLHATAICARMGKEALHYLGSEHGHDYMDHLMAELGVAYAGLVDKVEGEGIWVHPRLGLHMALWADAAFALELLAEWVGGGNVDG